jgi:hypothetical protein
MIKKILAATLSTVLIAGTSFASPMTLTESEMDGVSAQGLQIITNDNRDFAPIVDQDNNLDSVQLNNNAEQNSKVAGIINSAKSAVNASANILKEKGNNNNNNKSFHGSFSQSNTNLAINHQNTANDVNAEEEFALAINLNKQTQVIINTGLSVITDQDNNNNSVQLNDNAQQNSEGVSIINASTSALNFGFNLFSANDVSATGSQSNMQIARNMRNYAEAQTGEEPLAIAGNAELGITQTINNVYGVNGKKVSTITDQDNNNNSVQVNDNAQENAKVASIMNSAQSAVNASGNLATMKNVSGSDISQSNKNIAENHVNVAKAEAENGIAIAGNLNKQTQNVHNMDEAYEGITGMIEDQDNNNNSVQINDNGQRAVKGILLMNSASSAVNAALNVMDADNVQESSLRQSNKQVARNYENTADSHRYGELAIAGNAEISDNPGQYINNVHVTIHDQNNNNNSVQLNDNAQKDIVVDKTINSANSAVNLGQNIMNLGDVTGSTISQSNMQYAGNHNNYATSSGTSIAANINKQIQVVDNCFCTDLRGAQDNNMNSVQLNDNAQQNAMGVFIVNAADSAVNGGLNMIVSGTVLDSTMTQSNTNTAVNFSNNASGRVAIAGNAELGGVINGIGMLLQ